MDLFTYLMAKKGQNTGRDLFSYLLGKNAGESGTYTTFSGVSLNISNTLKARIKNLKLNPTKITQSGTPSPDSPVDVNVIKGDNTITISNSDNTQSQNYSINLGDLEYAKFGNYEDEIYTENGNWYLKENVGKIILDGTQTIGNINLDKENTTRVTYISFITNGINTISLLCNRLERKNMFNSDEEGIYYNATNGNLFFRINKTLIGTTTNEINTYLANNNIKVYYPMSSPIFTQITDTTLIGQLENIHNNATSYNGQTNITQTNDDLPFNISVDVKVKEEE